MSLLFLIDKTINPFTVSKVKRKLLRLFTCTLSLLLMTVVWEMPVFADTMDESVDRVFREMRCVGGAFIVAQHGNIVYERYYGLRHKTTGEPVDENTIFKCASVTKFVTGIGLQKMMDDGILDPDEDISTFLGYPVGNPRYPGTKITLRMLMSHTSSINEGASFNYQSSRLSDMIALSRKARSNFREVRPGTQYKYSNFGAGITGSIIESVTGEDVSSFMRHYLFEPLGMDAAYTAKQISAQEDIAATYRKDGSLYQAPSFMLRKEYEEKPNPDLHYRITVGSLLIRPRDLARLGIVACGDGTLEGIRVLSEEAVQRMRQPQSLETTGITEKSPYSFFCIRQEDVLKGRMLYGHQGTNEGIVCNLYFEPESELVFCVMTNGCRSARDNGVIRLTRKLIEIATDEYLTE